VFFTVGILTQAAHLPSQARGQDVSHRGHGGNHKGHGHAELGKVSTENTIGLITIRNTRGIEIHVRVHLSIYVTSVSPVNGYTLRGWCMIPAHLCNFSQSGERVHAAWLVYDTCAFM
jgi:hypothetical protein